jgi:hypothetical protein
MKGSMMKKLMILALVVGMASLASAGLSLDIAVPGQVSAASDGADAYVGWITWSSELAVVSHGLTAGAGSLAWADDYSVNNGGDLGQPSIGSVYVINFGPGSVTGDLVAGSHYTVEFAGVQFGAIDNGLGRVDLISEDLSTIIATTYVTPEPMTMALLGLGGLFLRRRK